MICASVVRETTPSSNMADTENTNMEVDDKKNKPTDNKVDSLIKTVTARTKNRNNLGQNKNGRRGLTTTEYCEQLQAWMWQYYTGYVNWQSWLSAAAALPCPFVLQSPTGVTVPLDINSQNWHNGPFGLALSSHPAGVSSQSARAVGAAGGAPVTAQPQQLPPENGNALRQGREYNIPSPLQRLLAEMVDFFILFFIKATIIISIMHLSGIKDVSKFAMHFIVEEIDEDTSMEELQKMMLVALVYRILVCFYEIVCIWGAGGATPGKFLVGLRVVTCDSSVLVQPDRILVVPATNVSLSASAIRALNKNFSIAFFFPAFITLLFFQHNRTVYDMVAGTIVVKRSRVR